jgi:hypothetical protein
MGAESVKKVGAESVKKVGAESVKAFFFYIKISFKSSLPLLYGKNLIINIVLLRTAWSS